MKREKRYLVLKRRDIERYLTAKEFSNLIEIDSIINYRRQQESRGLLNAVVVESDWPMYVQTWKEIKRYVNKKPKNDAAILNKFRASLKLINDKFSRIRGS